MELDTMKTGGCLSEEELFAGRTNKQISVMQAAFMVLCGDAWLLYEKEDGWYLAVKRLDELEKTLWCKIRIAGQAAPMTLEDLYIDFYRTDFNEKTKFELLYYTEKNRELLLEPFLGKFAPKGSEAYQTYQQWVIKK